MAVRTIANGGGNWSANGTWVEGVAPTAADDVVATATSGSVTIDTTTCVAKSADFTNYPVTSTVTFTAAKILTVSGNFKMIAGMNVAGTGTLYINATANLTSGGVIFPGAFTFDGGIKTLLDDWVITGLVTAATTINGYSITCNGGLSVPYVVLGSTNFILGGGTWSGTNTTGIANNLTIAGDVTVSGNVYYKTGTLTYTSGTVTVTGSTLNITGNCALNTSGMTWSTLLPITATSTVTLLSDLNVFCLRLSSSILFTGAYDVNVNYYVVTNSTTVAIPSGQTMTISDGILAGAMNVGNLQRHNPVIRAYSASSPAYLVYQGTQNNCNLMSIVFTDIDASGSAIKLYNYQGGTLTRTVNIENVVLPPAKFNPVNGCSFIKGVK